MASQHGFDLAAKVGAIYLDGGGGMIKAFPGAFPRAPILRCLQHVKKDIMQATKVWTKRNLGKQVKAWVHRSAFLPPPLFSLFWHGALQELRDVGEARFVFLVA